MKKPKRKAPKIISRPTHWFRFETWRKMARTVGCKVQLKHSTDNTAHYIACLAGREVGYYNRPLSAGTKHDSGMLSWQLIDNRRAAA
jgi:predicted RNase H-like nuclease (RuvC/YqgF family)